MTPTVRLRPETDREAALDGMEAAHRMYGVVCWMMKRGYTREGFLHMIGGAWDATEAKVAEALMLSAASSQTGGA